MDHHQRSLRRFKRLSRSLRWRGIKRLHGQIVTLIVKAFLQAGGVTAGLADQTAIVLVGIFQREPEANCRHRRGVKKGGILMHANFTTDEGLFHNHHRLHQPRILQLQPGGQIGQFASPREPVKFCIKIMQRMADLVQCLMLRFDQITLFIESSGFKKEADFIARFLEINVSGMGLIVR